MTTDLHARALAQEALLRTAAADVTEALAAARAGLSQRHEAPGSVSRDDWGSALGAVQHKELAVAALDDVRARHTVVRAALAAIANPADADTHETELRSLLVEEASLRVQLRHARERVAAGDAMVSELSALTARVDGELAAAASRTTWGNERRARAQALRDALDEPPLDTIVADAEAVRTGPAIDDARDRLDELVPPALRTRAEQRAIEATAVADRARDGLATVLDRAAALDAEDAPLQAAIAAGERALLEAERALADYVAGAAGRLAAAQSALAEVAGLADLSAAQAAAIADRFADSGDALTDEGALAGALAALFGAEGAVDDAIIAALVADPDADPDDDADVIDARAALAEGAIQDPVAEGRIAYGDSSREALDALEVEVPPGVWAGILAVANATATLGQLADGAARAALVQDLGDAEDEVAAALDERDIAIRSRWHLGMAVATRAGAAAAAEATAADRRRHYVHGDGASGRTPIEL